MMWSNNFARERKFVSTETRWHRVSDQRSRVVDLERTPRYRVSVPTGDHVVMRPPIIPAQIVIQNRGTYTKEKLAWIAPGESLIFELRPC